MELSAEQRNLPPAAYKNADGSRRAAASIITSVEYEKETKGNEQQATQAKEYAVHLEGELQKVCEGILALMDESLILSASTGEPWEFYYEMKGDYYRFLAECVTDDAKSNVAEEVTIPVARPYPEHLDVPCANPIVQTVLKTVEVPQVRYVAKIGDVSVMRQGQVPTIRTVQRTVEVPQVQFFDPAVGTSLSLCKDRRRKNESENASLMRPTSPFHV